MIAAEEKKIAARVLSKFKVMFPSFGARMDDDEEWTNLMIDEWSKGLSGIPLVDVIHAIELVRRSGSEFAPALPKFIEFCGGRPKLHKALEYQEEDQIDYSMLWSNADDKGKYRFFVDHPFHLVPGYVRQWFINYNKKERGWSAHESNMMIKFHAQPQWLEVSDQEQDNRRDRLNKMKDEHQKGIIEYFLNRSNA
jgi:hypothetical protein